MRELAVAVWFARGLAGALCLLGCRSAAAEAARVPAEDRWAFVEAWTVFRRDLEATAPGEHGEVYLVERVGAMPPWLAHDAVRTALAPPVVSMLAGRLAAAGDRAAVPALGAALDRARAEPARRALERALVRLGDAERLARVAERLRSASAPERWRAAEALAAAGAAGVPALRAALADPDGATRLVSAAALASGGDRRARALLVATLSSANPFERVEAAHGLALAGDPRAVPVLRDALAAPGADRARAARSLGLVGGPPERRLLLDALGRLPRDRSRAFRRALTIGAGQITARLALPEVVRYLDDLEEPGEQDRGPRADALSALGRAAAAGATDRRALATRVAAELESPLPDETPVAFERRRELVGPLADLLAGRGARAPAGPSGPRDLAAAREALRSVGGDARARLGRLQAAVFVLDRIGERLGHAAISEPPSVRVVGLGAERAVDGNLATAWVAGPMAGPLRLELPRPTRLRRLHVVGGCVSDRHDYAAHGRVRRLAVSRDGGEPVVAELADSDPYFQPVELPVGEVSALVLEVLSVHPGRREGAPACIAEIRLE